MMNEWISKKYDVVFSLGIFIINILFALLQTPIYPGEPSPVKGQRIRWPFINRSLTS